MRVTIVTFFELRIATLKPLSSVLLSAAALSAAALSLSACAGSASGGPAYGGLGLPEAQAVRARFRPHDSGPQDLHAGGASSPAIAYALGDQPAGSATSPQLPPGSGSLFDVAPTNGTVYYCQSSSGYGRKEFENPSGDGANAATNPCAPLGAPASGFGGRQDPLDFVGSDVAMPSTEYSTYKTYREPVSGTNYGEPFEFPVMAGAEVIGYRPKDFKAALGTKPIQLSTWSLCAIANGTISDWNDPAITRDNGGVSITGGVARPVTFYFRSDSAATTFYFTHHLAAVCLPKNFAGSFSGLPYEANGHSAVWTYGIAQGWPGPGGTGPANPNFVGESGNAGVLTGIQATRFATGYTEYAWVASANPPVSAASLQTEIFKGKTIFVPANAKTIAAAVANIGSTSLQYGEGSDGSPVGTSRPECMLYVNPVSFVRPPVGSYPIIGMSYLLFYSKNNAHFADDKRLIEFLDSAQAASIENSLNYAPLSLSLRTAVRQALNGTQTKSRKPPCLQS